MCFLPWKGGYKEREKRKKLQRFWCRSGYKISQISLNAATNNNSIFEYFLNKIIGTLHTCV